ncbi:hypothetical protein F9B85_04010 [Heliorestis acidaminivorans]|uniref:Fibronectin type-III domain-containing protein n=1 Tax=Heliorestis acidaminivorans TaxID=553427 RepID=A0A6I0F2K9_9FIRM|nr:IPT/TIG domain-containing protein [Heliorestis acidaminivorans]KAB2953790.1 hypothetical protein F9B85_04010 [Heliorestis acidaminivorans]
MSENSKKRKIIISWLLLCFFIMSIFPIHVFAQDIVVETIYYKAQDRGQPLHFEFTGTNLDRVNLTEIKLARGTNEYPVYGTSREPLGGNRYKIKGSVHIDTEINQGVKLDLVLGQTITVPNAFHYQFANVRNTHFTPSYAKPNERQKIDIIANDFIDIDGHESIERKVILTTADNHTYTYIVEPNGQNQLETNLQENPSKAFYWRDPQGVYRVSLLSPSLPQGNNNIMTIFLEREMHYGTQTKTIIEERTTVPGEFYIYNPEGSVPVIKNVKAQPLLGLGIEQEINVQSSNQIEVIVTGENLVENAGDSVILLIKGRQIGSISTQANPTTPTEVKFGIPPNLNLAVGYEIVDATILRSDGALSDPFRITLWADPYHRYRNTLEVVPEVGSGIEPDEENGESFFWLASGQKQRFKIEAKDRTGFTGANQVFADLAEDWDPLTKSFKTEALRDQVTVAIGAKRLTILNVTPVSIEVETPSDLTVTNVLESIIISSPWGRSPVDQRIKVYSPYSDVDIVAVEPASRTVLRTVDQFDLEVKARNMGPNSTVRLERTVNGTLETLEPVNVNYRTGEHNGENVGIIRARFTAEGNNFQQAPSDWNLVVITGTGEVALRNVDEFKVEKVAETIDGTTVDKFVITGGFRFLSTPHFPALHQPGQPIVVGSDYLNRLKTTVVTPYEEPDKPISHHGGHIITLTSAQDFFQFWLQENNSRTLYHPQVFIQWEQDDGTSRLVPSTEVFLEEPNDPIRDGQLANQKLHFRLPNLSQSGSLPSDGWVNIKVINVDNQEVIIPRALRIKSDSPIIMPPDLQITPTQVPDVDGRMVSISNGEGFSDVTKVFMGFHSSEQLFVNQHDESMLFFTTTKQTYRDDEYNTNGQRYPRTKPVTLIFADGRAYYNWGVPSPLALTFIEQRYTQPTIDQILPAYGPYNTDDKPIIFVKGNNFLSPGDGSAGSARELEEIWLNNKQVWPPTSENGLNQNDKPQVYRLTTNGVTSEYIAFTLPRIKFDTSNAEIERQLRTDMTLFLVFNDETAHKERAFTLYKNDDRLRLERMAPLTGPEGFSMPISIEGAGFRAEGRLPEVYIGGLPALDITVSENGQVLSFRTPPLQRGEYKITIANPITKDVLTFPTPYRVLAGQDTGDPQITRVLIDGQESPPTVLRSTGGQRIRIEGVQFVVNDDPRQLPEIYLQNVLIEEEYLITKSADEVFQTGVIEFYAPPLDVSRIDRVTEATLLIIRKADARSVTRTLPLVTSLPNILSVAPPGIKVDNPGRTESVYIYGTDLFPGMTASFYDNNNNLIVRVPRERVVTQTINSEGRPNQAVFEVIFSPEDMARFLGAYNPNPARNKLNLIIENPDGNKAERREAFTLIREGPVPEIIAISAEHPNQYVDADRSSAIGGAEVNIRVRNLVPQYYEDQDFWPLFFFGGVPAETLGYEKDNNTIGEAIWRVRVPAYPWPDELIGTGISELPVDVMVVNSTYLTSSTKANAFTYLHSYKRIDLVEMRPRQYQYRQGEEMEAIIFARPGRTSDVSEGFIKIGNRYPEVYFGNQRATVIDKDPDAPWPRTELTVIVPPGRAGVVDVRVLNPDGSEGILRQYFTYVQSNPTIQMIVPCGVDVEDQEQGIDKYIYIHGTDFFPGFTVRFGDEDFDIMVPGRSRYDVTEEFNQPGGGGIERVTFDEATGKWIVKVKVPPLQDLFATRDRLSDSKYIPVRIINPDGSIAVSPKELRLFSGEEAPQIISVEPPRAFATGGETVLITVTNLELDYRDKRNWPSFAFGGIPVSPNTSNPTNINYPVDPTVNDSNEPIRLIKAGESRSDEWIWAVRVPPYPLPNDVDDLLVDVHIITPDCVSGLKADYFTYLRSARQIDLIDINPTSSPTAGGITAIIRANFTPRIDANNPGSPGFIEINGQLPTVFFGSEEAVVTNVTRTELTVIVPPHAIGTVDIKVINPDGRTYGILTNAFTYADMPHIQSVIPSSGPQAGGIPIVIRGSGFMPNITVTFGGTTAEIVSVTSTEIVVILPPGPTIPDNDIRITVLIIVTNPDGQSFTYEPGFTYYSDGGLPEDPPEILTKVIDRHTIRITWPQVNMAQAYEIEVSEGDRGNFRLYEVLPATSVQQGEPYILVRGLQPETRYWFRVRAISSAGPGPYSEAVSATTSDERGWDGFTVPEIEYVIIPDGLKMLIRKGNLENHLDLRQNNMGAARTKAVSFSPDAQGFSTPLLIDSGNWKALLPPLALSSNGSHMMDSYATLQVGPVSDREAERIVLANRNRRPLSPIYEVKISYDKGTETFTPATYRQPITLTLNYNNSTIQGQNRRPSLYWYDGQSRNWIRVESYSDPLATSAAINRAGYYAVFAD